MNKNVKRSFFTGALALALVGAVFSASAATTTAKATTAVTQASALGPFRMTLIEAMDVSFSKSAGVQPKFYVVGANGRLQSSATITFPANRKIILTIVSYDGGNALTPKEFTKVTGTVGNKMAIINGKIASGAKTSEAWMKEVSSVSPSKILHTFTVAGLGINIPVEAGTTSVVVIPPITKTGTFAWHCMAACGCVASGWGCAMDTAGWMMGSVVVVGS